MKKIILVLLVLIPGISFAQTKDTTCNVAVGFELDALPYITGGYYGSAWVGYKHMRYRAIVTKINTPEFVLQDGFTNNKIQAYTVIADYFFKPNFEKFWVGAGIEYWDGNIQSDAKLSTEKYKNWIFTVGGGYVWKFYKNFYVNPWAAAHIRIAGDTKVTVDGKEFKPALFTPEFSVKIGWCFNP